MLRCRRRITILCHVFRHRRTLYGEYDQSVHYLTVCTTCCALCRVLPARCRFLDDLGLAGGVVLVATTASALAHARTGLLPPAPSRGHSRATHQSHSFALLLTPLSCFYLQLWVAMLLTYQPFYVGGFEDHAVAKDSAFGAMFAFIATFVISLAVRWRDGRRKRRDMILARHTYDQVPRLDAVETYEISMELPESSTVLPMTTRRDTTTR